MTLGRSPSSGSGSSTGFCADRLSPTSIYGLLHRDGDQLFPDEAFADLFQDIGRWSVAPRIVAVVMVLQRLEGLSDREAVDRFSFDLRWKYAAGGLDFDYPGFVHTVLVDMRARLRRSERPNRIFEMALAVAREAGLIGRKRVLDSTALYDAVATQDTVTLIRSAIRALLRVVDKALGAELRSCCKRDDDYVAPGKPLCDWDDVQAREALVDALARDAYAVLAALDGRTLAAEVTQAATLVATVVGQDLEQRDDGTFRIARRVAKDRVISTVDPEARHGHKTAARGFDGYKGHIAIDPDSEIITATTVTAGNVADGNVAEALVTDLLDETPAAASGDGATPSSAAVTTATTVTAGDGNVAEALVTDVLDETPAAASEDGATPSSAAVTTATTVTAGNAADGNAVDGSVAEAIVDKVVGATPVPTPLDLASSLTEPMEIYGDASYGTAKFVEAIESAGAEANVKVQPPAAPEGKFAKDAFAIDLTSNTVRCPAGVLVVISSSTAGSDGFRRASFGARCSSCELRSQCTDGKDGRTIRVHPQEATLQRARMRQRDPAWKARYRATRPKVERKIAHLMFRRHGGRRARVRGCARIRDDFALLSAASNLKRLASLGVRHDGVRWVR
jgi:Transposase DDE domain/Transposase domain (DUF772)